eukprot:gnl/TRDRNA2_/TRDRNA2_193004_c0_seq1.p1 gnl/TRDRNA2_/TRDRNA2_193004_c0~~gnl/TRDRNA2_/TRDRNA2_193004_c0_seq1.p1  ORF type:complete len:385 (+),score=59.23 gnl/TRDRNA2_/TRDRNA2_193004_c0_seq1:46-1200(+)
MCVDNVKNRHVWFATDLEETVIIEADEPNRAEDHCACAVENLDFDVLLAEIALRDVRIAEMEIDRKECAVSCVNAFELLWVHRDQQAEMSPCVHEAELALKGYAGDMTSKLQKWLELIELLPAPEGMKRSKASKRRRGRREVMNVLGDQLSSLKARIGQLEGDVTPRSESSDSAASEGDTSSDCQPQQMAATTIPSSHLSGPLSSQGQLSLTEAYASIFNEDKTPGLQANTKQKMTDKADLSNIDSILAQVQAISAVPQHRRCTGGEETESSHRMLPGSEPRDVCGQERPAQPEHGKHKDAVTNIDDSGFQRIMARYRKHLDDIMSSRGQAKGRLCRPEHFASPGKALEAHQAAFSESSLPMYTKMKLPIGPLGRCYDDQILGL